MMTLRNSIMALPPDAFALDGIRIRPIRDDQDLWYAVVICRIPAWQQEYVNPAGFSIGRAYLHPESHLPCIILKDTQPIGYIALREWHDGSATSWSYYLDERHQGFGYGTTAARLAVQLLQAAQPGRPIKLSAEAENTNAHRLYRKLGFSLSDERDGDDLIFIL